ncbi:MAG: carboxypeptidase regulatory-like domain-containing protein, partial [Saprospiraceae bacterium]|nr:carboxypeptidase regulatory-like domain-containing protein [Pyrinomonadaceae bacterium]
FFGVSVAISGDTVVVGSSNDTIGGATQRGSAYIYQRNNGGPDGWGEIKKIVALDGAEDDLFGNSVSISNNTVVVGAIYSGGGVLGNGAAYIFSQNAGGGNNWGQIKKLAAPDGSDGDFFGGSVGISGDTVIVGAENDNIAAVSEGSAYIFERNAGGTGNWGQLRKLVVPNGNSGANFGHSVSVSGNVVIVGANQDAAGANGTGSAHIHERDAGGPNNWGQVKKLAAADGATGDFFGQSVSISGDAVIVGAPFDDVAAGTDQGSAYVFSQNAGGADNWGQVTKLTAADGAAGDIFGYAVAVSGDNFLVGAYLANVPAPFTEKQASGLLGGTQQGASYIFRGSALSPTAASVSISGRILTADGRGIAKTRITLTNAAGQTRTVASSSFGYYRFDEVPAGETYIISAGHKQYQFTPRIIGLTGEINDLNFIAGN